MTLIVEMKIAVCNQERCVAKVEKRQSKCGIGELTMYEKIEQLAKEIQCSQEEEKCFYCVRKASCCVGFDIALKVIKAGYRKESDTAREILTELLDFVNGWFEGVENNDFGVEFNRISIDLAEKYGVDLGE
jgi:hypothetical protein